MLEATTKDSSGDLTRYIFQESWWLDIVAPQSWNRLNILKSDRIVASMPVVFGKNRWGQKAIVQPPFTPFLGPTFESMTCKKVIRESREKEYLNELMASFEDYPSFLQQFHYSFDNILPFIWRGYSHSARVTYVLQDLSNLENVWRDLDDGVKSDIKKGEKFLSLAADVKLEEFISLYKATFVNKSHLLGHIPLIENLVTECLSRKRGRFFGARAQDGKLAGAIFVVWDEVSIYYLLSASDSKLKKMGVNSFLLWESIGAFSDSKKRFDFEGSMIEPIERFIRSFGGQREVYFRIYKQSILEKIYEFLILLARIMLGRK